MNDENTEAHSKYIKLLALQQEKCGCADIKDIQLFEENRHKISLLILQFLTHCRPTEKFRFGEFLKIIRDSSGIEHFEATKAEEAFLNLEKYVLLLYLNPWKQEFHRIKVRVVKW